MDGSRQVWGFWYIKELHAPWPARFILSIEFSRQEYCYGLPFSPPRDLPNPGIKPMSPARQLYSSPSEPLGKPLLLPQKRTTCLRRFLLKKICKDNIFKCPHSGGYSGNLILFHFLSFEWCFHCIFGFCYQKKVDYDSLFCGIFFFFSPHPFIFSLMGKNLEWWIMLISFQKYCFIEGISSHGGKSRVKYLFFLRTFSWFSFITQVLVHYKELVLWNPSSINVH